MEMHFIYMTIMLDVIVNEFLCQSHIFWFHKKDKVRPSKPHVINLKVNVKVVPNLNIA